MSNPPSFLTLRRRSPRRRRWCPCLEQLEARDLPAVNFGTGSLLPAESPVNDTLDQAVPLTLGTSGVTEVQAAVGDSPAGAADVDFYSLTLAQTSHVTLNVHGDGSAASLQSILTLYGADPTATLKYRVAAQDDGSTHGGDAVLDLELGAGTWYVAVSGAGNRYFEPFLAHSGYDGDTGPYTLTASATSLGLTGSDGPVLLLANPSPNTVLSSSPLTLRLQFSGAIDNGTYVAGSTVRLTWNADGNFGGAGDVPVALASVKRISGTNELVLTPAAPLKAGFYQVFLAGNKQAHTSVLTSSGKPLGKDATQPFGQDVVFTFQVDGVEGNTNAGAGADDTVDTAHNLGDVSNAGLVQVAGAIGDDPTDPVPFNRSDVDLYRFTVSGEGHYSLGAEVFAGRIGSPLDAALSLFQLGPNPGDEPVFIASNDTTLNDIQDDEGHNALQNDPALFAGLTAGDYLLAVSSSGNLPDAFTPVGTNGVFDPLVSHSGTAGQSRGAYVLNLVVQPAPETPHVVSVSLAEGATLDGPPTTITVQFDSAVNLDQLSFDAYQLTAQGGMPAVFVAGADGNDYFPRLQSYDPDTNQATFLFLEPVPAGAAEFHLAGQPASGDPGLTSLGGIPLAGNQTPAGEGDYVVHFTVGGAPRGSSGSPTLWQDQGPNDTFDNPQDLGPLFPLELANGVTIQRDLGTETADTADYFRFAVLQSQAYFISLTNTIGLASDALPEVFDAAGNLVDAVPQVDGTVQVSLDPGTYVLCVQGWSSDQAANVSYTATLTLQGAPEQPTPLTTGPTPALRIRLDNGVTPPPTVPTPPVPQVVLAPASGAPVPTVTLVSIPADSGAASFEPSSFGATTVSLLNSLPSGVLRSLGASPLGGTRGAGPGDADRVEQVVLPSNSELPESFARVAVFVGLLTAPGDVGVDTAGRVANPSGLDVRTDWQAALHSVARQGTDIVAVARNTFGHLASETGDLVESSVAVVDGLFARWNANASVTLAPPTPTLQKREESTAAPVTSAGAREPVTTRSEGEARTRWFVPGLAWGGAVALALVTGRHLGRRKKIKQDGARVSIG
jgi:hypothetical protein